MNKKNQITDLFDKVITKLQKRDEMLLNLGKTIPVGNNLFSEYEIAYYIANIYKKKYSIPNKYLKFYIKPADRINYKKVKIDPQIKKIITGELVEKKIDKQLMAGGSLAKTYLKKIKNKNVIIKSASGWPSKKLTNEIFYLEYLNNFKDVSRHIPLVIERKINQDNALLILKYYPRNTLSYNILFSKIKKKDAWNLTKRVLDFVSESIWVKKTETTPENYIEDFFLNRILNNTNKLISESELFKKISKNKTIFINGVEYTNLLEILKIIKKNKLLVKKLKPICLRTIWGDLHPNNILVDKNDFILIDPRGDTGDYLYDLGKIYHTYGPGRYDFIDNDLFDVEINFGKKTKIIRKFYDKHPAWGTYNKLQTIFEKNILKYIDKKDAYWQLRWEFFKFCIFATMPLFLIKNDNIESRAIVGYSNAVIFGNKFLKYIKNYEKK